MNDAICRRVIAWTRIAASRLRVLPVKILWDEWIPVHNRVDLAPALTAEPNYRRWRIRVSIDSNRLKINPLRALLPLHWEPNLQVYDKNGRSLNNLL
jgi:hypothetical protein